MSDDYDLQQSAKQDDYEARQRVLETEPEVELLPEDDLPDLEPDHDFDGSYYPGSRDDIEDLGNDSFPWWGPDE